MIPKKLQAKIEARKVDNTFRQLSQPHQLVDFASNDYLGFSMSKDIFDHTHHYLQEAFIFQNGSRGSRLLTGNHELYKDLEDLICKIHYSESALIFNSGYDANLGFFSCVPQRGDVVFYDELIHASIRDGITMGHAQAYKFKHNDLDDLKRKSQSHTEKNAENYEVYIVTESVFSMDGDTPDLKAIAEFCTANHFKLVVDEAHAVGIFGQKGIGLIHSLGIDTAVFARLITFGKALGCHGAAILGSQQLTDYLVNFSRPFIYTTALPPHSLMTIKAAYKALQQTHAIDILHENIKYFKEQTAEHQLQKCFINSDSAIQCCILPGNDRVKTAAQYFKTHGFDVKPIVSPTVPKGEERLRFCIHAYNTEDEMLKVLTLLATFLQ
ncbi:aminotransferase class I/II-fold pyridoxal phosphate-dependent enzyme [Gelidibacter salicanalis]|uniref:Aminotransferase class I/II-fold pyridoxal phosphate-dependent enzyme n=1 Tax=Gelidibacter salicanalis TaxID=291193 RepID=A0A934KUK4_9FLAO|nr:aminotransferase class I/II-fold pyridoxal phosphate-dependent enzyme [Gelidibacter salicanalis]MBJ7882290.1 aminotransferase class I/II-fold pyridoxal phosphate-dependent enzyme [Gelidibacter salicanalis]